jgi:hypothetical protein
MSSILASKFILLHIHGGLGGTPGNIAKKK